MRAALRELIQMVRAPSTSGREVMTYLAQTPVFHEELNEDHVPRRRDSDRLTLARSEDSVLEWVRIRSSDVMSEVVLPRGTRCLYVLEGRIAYLACDGGPRNERVVPVGEGELITFAPSEKHAIWPIAGEAELLDLRLDHAEVVRLRTIPRVELDERMSACEHQVDYYYGYGDRYEEVYRAGADTWETTEANEVLKTTVEARLELGPRVVDLGCGEGRDSLYLASEGFDVLGVDVSRAALNRAREYATAEGLRCRFVERDVVYLRHLEPASFDWAINMGCLHMMDDLSDRNGHLERVFEILVPGGIFLITHCTRNWGKGFFSIPKYEQYGKLRIGEVIPRRIRTGSGHKLIPLEVVPYKEANEHELALEVESAGFELMNSEIQTTGAFGDTAVILCRKPVGAGGPA